MIPNMEIAGKRFLPASRWWGTGLDGAQMEIDLVAMSTDRTEFLFGEVKWSDKPDLAETEHILRRKISNLPFSRDKSVVTALFVKSKPAGYTGDAFLYDPDDICP
jgi:hypothetical protein